MGTLLNILLMAAAVGVAVKWLLVYVGAPSWSYFVVLPVLGVLFYVLNCLLIRYYIQQRAPEFASDQPVADGVQKWELTAGLGIVPKWVSFIGLLAIACFLALLMPVIAPLFKRG